MKNLKYWLCSPGVWVGIVCYWIFFLTIGAFICGWIIARNENMDKYKDET